MSNNLILCNNQSCKLNGKCWRYNCPPDEINQRYEFYKPDIDEQTKETTCYQLLINPSEGESDEK